MDNENKYIFDVSEDQFNEKVLELSETKLIIVDFWAPWCGPCKQLTPLLEKIINKIDGDVHLVKINIDENQQIASQLNIQSIPAVFAFKNKKVVDAFQGVLPEKKILEFIEKHLDKKIEKDHSELYILVQDLFNKNKYDEAKNILEDHFAENSDDIKSISMYIDCLANMGSFNEISDFIKSLNADILINEIIKSSIQKLEIKKKNSQGPSLNDFKKKYEAKPNKVINIINLSDKFFSEGLIDEAFELLFKHYKLDKNAIKKKLLEFFNVLGNTDEKTIANRKKLSALLFS